VIERVVFEQNRTSAYTVSGGSKNYQSRRRPSSFIANAHNELYAFYTEKNYEPIGGGGISVIGYNRCCSCVILATSLSFNNQLYYVTGEYISNTL